MPSRLSVIAMAAGAFLAGTGAALAALGHPTPWQMDLQDAATPVMADIASFHDFLLWIIAAISLFVLILLLIVIVRFNARANPTPSRTTHNTPIEIIWTIVPVIILAVIAVPSFRLLFVELDVPHPDLTVKEWMTSAPVTSTCTTLLTGTTMSVSAVSSRGCPGLRSLSATINESNSKLPLSG